MVHLQVRNAVVKKFQCSKIALLCFRRSIAVIICMCIHVDVIAFHFVLRYVILYRDYSVSLHGTARKDNDSLGGCEVQ